MAPTGKSHIYWTIAVKQSLYKIKNGLVGRPTSHKGLIPAKSLRFLFFCQQSRRICEKD